MNSRRLPNFSCAVALLLVSTFAGVTAAQVDIPFQVVSGTGIVDQLPSPSAPSQNHNITSGTVQFGSQTMTYTGNGRVRLLAPPDATGSAPFDSDGPFQFDFGNGDSLQLHYGHPEFGAPSTGTAMIVPTGQGNHVNTTWQAVVNPVPGTGTGIFENVVGGAIYMTASQNDVDPTGTDLPYSWSSDKGFLTVVPEPHAIALLGFAACCLLTRRRRVA